MVPARACSSSPSNGERRNRSPSETKFRVLEEITCLVAEFLLKKFFSKLSQVYHIESGREMFELEVRFDTNYMVRKSHFFGIDLGNLDLNLFFLPRSTDRRGSKTEQQCGQGSNKCKKQSGRALVTSAVLEHHLCY